MPLPVDNSLTQSGPVQPNSAMKPLGSAFKPVTDALKPLGEALKPIEPYLAPVKTAIETALKPVTDSLQAAYGQQGNGGQVNPMAPAVSPAVSPNADPGGSSLFPAQVPQVLSQTLSPITPAVKELFKDFKPMPQFRPGMQQIMNKFGKPWDVQFEPVQGNPFEVGGIGG